MTIVNKNGNRFLEKETIDLGPREMGNQGKKADRIKVSLKDGIAAGFYEYTITVHTNPAQDAIGDSRPGAIIDR